MEKLFITLHYYDYLFCCFTEGYPEHNANSPAAPGVPGDNNKPQSFGGNPPQQSNIPPPLKSYSAVAAKQNQQLPPPLMNNTSNKNKTTRPPGFVNSPVAIETNPMALVDNKGSPINQEQLNNAKLQYISNAKQAVAAGMSNTGSQKPAVNQLPMSTTAQPVTESKNELIQQLSQQPIIQQHQSTSSDPAKLSYSRMTASKMEQKTDPIQGTTPRGQGELSKYGKVNRIAEGGNIFIH